MVMCIFMPGCTPKSEQSREMEPLVIWESRHRSYFCLRCIAF